MSSVVTRLLIWLVYAYQLALRPVLGGSCRFSPSCSSYALEAFERHGAWRGSRLALRRISRCHPMSPAGHDPVPSGKDF